jgi:hypothetical protein
MDNMSNIIDVDLIWGIILISTTLKCWVGQIIIAYSPKAAAKIRIIEPESDLDPTFFADLRGAAIWDAITLWTLPLAGILLIINNNLWTYFGLAGGGIYLYFVGRGIVSRLLLQRHDIRIGKPKKLKMNYLILLFWGLISIITIIIAVISLT